MQRIRLIIGIAAAVAFLNGVCGQLLAADVGKTNITVEVIIFSGRRNPTWQLQDTKQLENLRAKLKDLPEVFSAEPAEWSRLGFAGFNIRGGETLGLPANTRIYQGVVKTGHGKGAKYLKDVDGLEQTLIDESKKQPLEPGVKAAIAEYESARKAAQKK